MEEYKRYLDQERKEEENARIQYAREGFFNIALLSLAILTSFYVLCSALVELMVEITPLRTFLNAAFAATSFVLVIDSLILLSRRLKRLQNDLNV